MVQFTYGSFYRFGLAIILLGSCQRATTGEDEDRNSANVDDVEKVENSFAYDLNFLERFHQDLVLLQAPDGLGQAVVAPAYQGRVMTSTTGEMNSPGFGWINHELIQAQEVQPHFNAYGGEDRFWLGPEGGQYALFFPPESEFTFENWKTPAAIDTEPFELISSDEHSATFTRAMELTNYAGFTFRLQVDRAIQMLPRAEVESRLNFSLPDSVDYVAFASENTVTNTGDNAWEKERGLISIWILGMFNPSDQTTMVVPYNPASASSVPIVNSHYFGEVPDERLKTDDEVIYFKGDGKYRSKIGVPPGRARSVLGSYDAGKKTLTLVHFSYDANATNYVNSMWEIQSEPYGGDVVNAYNDGAVEGGGEQLGPFYELESSSWAAELPPGQSLTHTHTTVHLVGDTAQLNIIAQQVLGVSLNQIISAL
uniref:Uncharacterized protein n=1 Tax=Roseihalotalea indica TaxID=2867963 RepID=A0AA49GMG2_9BACT|nr:hypothetical protein K4G66_29345 [Tunicatimonas sp. TK19036]